MQSIVAIRNYVEKMTLILELNGMPRTAGRVLSYLLICSPQEQTMQALVDALGMSKSSISSSTQSLIQLKLIERISLAGERRDYYRIITDVWDMMMVRHLEIAKQLRDIAAEGIHLMDETEFTGNCKHLDEMYEFFDFWEQEMPLLLERWNHNKTKCKLDKANMRQEEE